MLFGTATPPRLLMRIKMMTSNLNNGRLFVSYSRTDAEVVQSICAALVARGISIWIDQNEIQGGEDILARINSGLEESKIFVAFVGDGYFDNGRFTSSEFGAAFYKATSTPDWQVLVVKLREDLQLPPMVASRLYLVHRDPESTADSLVQAIGRYDAQSSEVVECLEMELGKNLESIGIGDINDRDLDLLVTTLLSRRYTLLRGDGGLITFFVDFK